MIWGREQPRSDPPEDELMRFVWFFEFSPEHAKDISARNRQLDEDIESRPSLPEAPPVLHDGHMQGLQDH